MKNQDFCTVHSFQTTEVKTALWLLMARCPSDGNSDCFARPFVFRARPVMIVASLAYLTYATQVVFLRPKYSFQRMKRIKGVQNWQFFCTVFQPILSNNIHFVNFPIFTQLPPYVLYEKEQNAAHYAIDFARRTVSNFCIHTHASLMKVDSAVVAIAAFQ